MKNSPRHNPTKNTDASSAQKQQRLLTNTAQEYNSLQQYKSFSAPWRYNRLSTGVTDPGIRASEHMVIAPIESAPLRAAQGDDDIMSQEKTL